MLKSIKISFVPGLGAVQRLFFGLFQPNYIFCSPQSFSSVIILHIYLSMRDLLSNQFQATSIDFLKSSAFCKCECTDATC